MVIDLAALQVASGQAPRLARRDPGDRLGLTGKAESRKLRDALHDELEELHGRLWAEAKRSVLLVLQGVDTSGKDGVIRRVLTGLNPQGCSVTSFKAPSTLELAHDYLWRIHLAVPARGMIGIFNRSHYESVLVERVKDLVSKKVWSKRYDHINDFERMLSDEGVTIMKF